MHILINLGSCSFESRTPKGLEVTLILHTSYCSPTSISSESVIVSVSRSDSEVLVMEDFVGVLDDVFGWDSEGLLLDVNVNSWVLNNEWYFLGYSVLFDLVDGEFSNVGDFIWHLDLSGVVLPDLSDIWLINGDSVEGLVPLSLLEFVLNMEWLLLVLGDGDLR